MPGSDVPPALPPGLLADDSPVVILAGSALQGTVTFASPNLERVLRWKPEDVVGVPGWMARQLHAGDARRLAEAVRRGRSSFQAEARFRRGDGTETWVSLSGWLQPDGEAATGILWVQDHTDVVEARQADRRLAVNLEQMERMEGLARLAGGVAHDFNNLLSVIINFTEFAVEGLGSDPEAARADLAEVALAAARAAELTRKLTVFARRDLWEQAVTDASAALGASEAGLAARGAGQGVTVEVSPGTGPLVVPLDTGQLDQLLDQLTNNALDAMPDGGRLSVSAEAAAVPGAGPAPADLPAGRYVRLRVSDTGAGAPPEVVARMFEPFFTTRRRGVGSGLGLAVVHGLVGKAGGSLAVRSTPGLGTTVDAWLPEAGAGGAPEQPGPVAGGDGARLLVVDDEAPVLEAARRILSAAGYEVTATTDPGHARDLLEAGEAFAGLVTDVVMPTLSGPELAEAARNLTPGLPVLFVSGFAAGLLGADHTLPPGVRMLRKPFTDRELLARVSEAVREHP